MSVVPLMLRPTMAYFITITGTLMISSRWRLLQHTLKTTAMFLYLRGEGAGASPVRIVVYILAYSGVTRSREVWLSPYCRRGRARGSS